MRINRFFPFIHRAQSKRNRVLAVITRSEPQTHYEVHFNRHVEFWTLDGEKIGESKVYPVK